jgi:hypothetical protein
VEAKDPCLKVEDDKFKHYKITWKNIFLKEWNSDYEDDKFKHYKNNMEKHFIERVE